MGTVQNYAKAGVNRELADQLVERIASIARTTSHSKVKSSIGGYASLYQIDQKRWLAASTDGVGTKLKLAFQTGIHHTVGIDLVAMSVNDLLCAGAEPQFFLDYFATGKLKKGVAEKVIQGVVEGCRQAGVALVGGETAEMPDMYSPGEYDLAGFAVGWLPPKQVLPARALKPGDQLIGIRSSGVHSNGFSLVRKLIPSGPDGKKMAKKLLEPTRIYVRSLLPLILKRKLKGLAHITGSGFLNLPRLSESVSYNVCLPHSSERPEIFEWIAKRSRLPLTELAQTFNLGIGMVAAVDAKEAPAVLRHLRRNGEVAWGIGEVVTKRRQRGPSQVILHADSETVVLE